MTRALGDPNRHFFLTRSVARVMGLSLSEAIQEGALSAQGYSDMVTRCRACHQPDVCTHWLAQVRDADQAVPPGCPNAADYAALKPTEG